MVSHKNIGSRICRLHLTPYAFFWCRAEVDELTGSQKQHVSHGESVVCGIATQMTPSFVFDMAVPPVESSPRPHV